MHPHTNHPTQAAKSVRPQPLYTDAIFKMQVTFAENLNFFDDNQLVRQVETWFATQDFLKSKHLAKRTQWT
jgi:hypothetical protein